MYLFNAFYVTYGDNYKRYTSVTVFDLLAYSTGVSVAMTYIWPFLSCFHREKCRLLYFYIHVSLIDPIFTFSLQPGSGGKPFPDILCDCCCSWAQHNIGNLPSNVEQIAIVCSLARLNLDGVSGCGVTRYREELRIFVKL